MANLFDIFSKKSSRGTGVPEDEQANRLPARTSGSGDGRDGINNLHSPFENKDGAKGSGNTPVFSDIRFDKHETGSPFTIPKLKKTQKDLLTEISLDSREWQQEILPVVTKHFRNASSSTKFEFFRAFSVNNPERTQQYLEKRREMRQNGYSERDVADSFAFLYLEDDRQIEKICREGLAIGNLTNSTIGHPGMGVQLCRFIDFASPVPFAPVMIGKFLAFKIMKGRVKAVAENRAGTYLEPTPNCDSHIAKSGLDSAPASHLQLYEANQIYLFEYGDLNVEKVPRHVLPFAVVHFRYKEVLPIIKVPDSPPVLSPKLQSPLASTRVTVSSGKDADDPEYVIWCGRLKVKDLLDCQVKMVSTASAYKPARLGTMLDLKYSCDMKGAARRYFGELTCLRKSGEVYWKGWYINVAELRPRPDSKALFQRLRNYLCKTDTVAVVKPENDTVLLLVPDSNLTADLGLSRQHHFPVMLHCIFLSRQSAKFKSPRYLFKALKNRGSGGSTTPRLDHGPLSPLSISITSAPGSSAGLLSPSRTNRRMSSSSASQTAEASEHGNVPALAHNLMRLHRSLSTDLASLDSPTSQRSIPLGYDEGFLMYTPSSALVNHDRLQNAFEIQRQIQDGIAASGVYPSPRQESLGIPAPSSSAPLRTSKEQRRDVEQDDTITSSTSHDQQLRLRSPAASPDKVTESEVVGVDDMSRGLPKPSSPLPAPKESQSRSRSMYLPPPGTPVYIPTPVMHEPLAKKPRIDESRYSSPGTCTDRRSSFGSSGVSAHRPPTPKMPTSHPIGFSHSRSVREFPPLPVSPADSSTDRGKPSTPPTTDIDTADDMKNFLNAVLERKPSAKSPSSSRSFSAPAMDQQMQYPSFASDTPAFTPSFAESVTRLSSEEDAGDESGGLVSSTFLPSSSVPCVITSIPDCQFGQSLPKATSECSSAQGKMSTSMPGLAKASAAALITGQKPSIIVCIPAALLKRVSGMASYSRAVLASGLKRNALSLELGAFSTTHLPGISGNMSYWYSSRNHHHHHHDCQENHKNSIVPQDEDLPPLLNNIPELPDQLSMSKIPHKCLENGSGDHCDNLLLHVHGKCSHLQERNITDAADCDKRVHHKKQQLVQLHKWTSPAEPLPGSQISSITRNTCHSSLGDCAAPAELCHSCVPHQQNSLLHDFESLKQETNASVSHFSWHSQQLCQSSHEHHHFKAPQYVKAFEDQTPGNPHPSMPFDLKEVTDDLRLVEKEKMAHILVEKLKQHPAEEEEPPLTSTEMNRKVQNRKRKRRNCDVCPIERRQTLGSPSRVITSGSRVTKDQRSHSLPVAEIDSLGQDCVPYINLPPLCSTMKEKPDQKIQRALNKHHSRVSQRPVHDDFPQRARTKERITLKLNLSAIKNSLQVASKKKKFQKYKGKKKLKNKSIVIAKTKEKPNKTKNKPRIAKRSWKNVEKKTITLDPGDRHHLCSPTRSDLWPSANFSNIENAVTKEESVLDSSAPLGHLADASSSEFAVHSIPERRESLWHDVHQLKPCSVVLYDIRHVKAAQTDGLPKKSQISSDLAVSQRPCQNQGIDEIVKEIKEKEKLPCLGITGVMQENVQKKNEKETTASNTTYVQNTDISKLDMKKVEHSKVTSWNKKVFRHCVKLKSAQKKLMNSGTKHGNKEELNAYICKTRPQKKKPVFNAAKKFVGKREHRILKKQVKHLPRESGVKKVCTREPEQKVPVMQFTWEDVCKQMKTAAYASSGKVGSPKKIACLPRIPKLSAIRKETKGDSLDLQLCKSDKMNQQPKNALADHISDLPSASSGPLKGILKHTLDTRLQINTALSKSKPLSKPSESLPEVSTHIQASCQKQGILKQGSTKDLISQKKETFQTSVTVPNPELEPLPQKKRLIWEAFSKRQSAPESSPEIAKQFAVSEKCDLKEVDFQTNQVRISAEKESCNSFPSRSWTKEQSGKTANVPEGSKSDGAFDEPWYPSSSLQELIRQITEKKEQKTNVHGMNLKEPSADITKSPENKKGHSRKPSFVSGCQERKPVVISPFKKAASYVGTGKVGQTLRMSKSDSSISESWVPSVDLQNLVEFIADNKGTKDAKKVPDIIGEKLQETYSGADSMKECHHSHASLPSPISGLDLISQYRSCPDSDSADKQQSEDDELGSVWPPEDCIRTNCYGKESFPCPTLSVGRCCESKTEREIVKLEKSTKLRNEKPEVSKEPGKRQKANSCSSSQQESKEGLFSLVAKVVVKAVEENKKKEELKKTNVCDDTGQSDTDENSHSRAGASKENRRSRSPLEKHRAVFARSAVQGQLEPQETNTNCTVGRKSRHCSDSSQRSRSPSISRSRHNVEKNSEPLISPIYQYSSDLYKSKDSQIRTPEDIRASSTRKSVDRSAETEDSASKTSYQSLVLLKRPDRDRRPDDRQSRQYHPYNRPDSKSERRPHRKPVASFKMAYSDLSELLQNNTVSMFRKKNGKDAQRKHAKAACSSKRRFYNYHFHRSAVPEEQMDDTTGEAPETEPEPDETRTMQAEILDKILGEVEKETIAEGSGDQPQELLDSLPDQMSFLDTEKASHFIDDEVRGLPLINNIDSQEEDHTLLRLRALHDRSRSAAVTSLDTQTVVISNSGDERTTLLGSGCSVGSAADIVNRTEVRCTDPEITLLAGFLSVESMPSLRRSDQSSEKTAHIGQGMMMPSSEIFREDPIETLTVRNCSKHRPETPPPLIKVKAEPAKPMMETDMPKCDESKTQPYQSKTDSVPVTSSPESDGAVTPPSRGYYIGPRTPPEPYPGTPPVAGESLKSKTESCEFLDSLVPEQQDQKKVDGEKKLQCSTSSSISGLKVSTSGTIKDPKSAAVANLTMENSFEQKPSCSPFDLRFKTENIVYHEHLSGRQPQMTADVIDSQNTYCTSQYLIPCKEGLHNNTSLLVDSCSQLKPATSRIESPSNPLHPAFSYGQYAAASSGYPSGPPQNSAHSVAQNTFSPLQPFPNRLLESQMSISFPRPHVLPVPFYLLNTSTAPVKNFRSSQPQIPSQRRLLQPQIANFAGPQCNESNQLPPSSSHSSSRCHTESPEVQQNSFAVPSNKFRQSEPSSVSQDRMPQIMQHILAFQDKNQFKSLSASQVGSTQPQIHSVSSSEQNISPHIFYQSGPLNPVNNCSALQSNCESFQSSLHDPVGSPHHQQIQYMRLPLQSSISLNDPSLLIQSSSHIFPEPTSICPLASGGGENCGSVSAAGPAPRPADLKPPSRTRHQVPPVRGTATATLPASFGLSQGTVENRADLASIGIFQSTATEKLHDARCGKLSDRHQKRPRDCPQTLLIPDRVEGPVTLRGRDFIPRGKVKKCRKICVSNLRPWKLRCWPFVLIPITSEERNADYKPALGLRDYKLLSSTFIHPDPQKDPGHAEFVPAKISTLAQAEETKKRARLKASSIKVLKDIPLEPVMLAGRKGPTDPRHPFKAAAVREIVVEDSDLEDRLDGHVPMKTGECKRIGNVRMVSTQSLPFMPESPLGSMSPTEHRDIDSSCKPVFQNCTLTAAEADTEQSEVKFVSSESSIQKQILKKSKYCPSKRGSSCFNSGSSPIKSQYEAAEQQSEGTRDRLDGWETKGTVQTQEEKERHFGYIDALNQELFLDVMQLESSVESEKALQQEQNMFRDMLYNKGLTDSGQSSLEILKVVSDENSSNKYVHADGSKLGEGAEDADLLEADSDASNAKMREIASDGSMKGLEVVSGGSMKELMASDGSMKGLEVSSDGNA